MAEKTEKEIIKRGPNFNTPKEALEQLHKLYRESAKLKVEEADWDKKDKKIRTKIMIVQSARLFQQDITEVNKVTELAKLNNAISADEEEK